MATIHDNIIIHDNDEVSIKFKNRRHYFSELQKNRDWYEKITDDHYIKPFFYFDNLRPVDKDAQRAIRDAKHSVENLFIDWPVLRLECEEPCLAMFILIGIKTTLREMRQLVSRGVFDRIDCNKDVYYVSPSYVPFAFSRIGKKGRFRKLKNYYCPYHCQLWHYSITFSPWTVPENTTYYKSLRDYFNNKKTFPELCDTPTVEEIKRLPPSKQNRKKTIDSSEPLKQWVFNNNSIIDTWITKKDLYNKYLTLQISDHHPVRRFWFVLKQVPGIGIKNKESNGVRYVMINKLN